MSSPVRLHRGQRVLHRTWSVVTHLVDDVEPDPVSTVAPVGADGTRVKPFSQNR